MKVYLLSFLMSICIQLTAQDKIFTINPGEDIEKRWIEATTYFQRHQDSNVALIFSQGTYSIRNELKLSNIRGKGSFQIIGSPSGSVAIYGSIDISNFSIVKNIGNSFLLKTKLNEELINKFSELTSDYNRLELYMDGQRMNVARYPDEGFITITDVTGITETENGAYKEGFIKYEDKMLTHLSSDSYLNGFWNYDWDATYQKVEKIDKQNKIITLGNSHYGYRKGGRFYALNAYDFLNVPGEYYLDKSTATLYIVSNHKNTTVQIPVNQGWAMFNFDNSENISVEGIRFSCGLNRAITASNTTNVRIKGCHFSCFGADCLYFTNCQNSQFTNNYFNEVCEKCIWVSGGDRKNLISSETEITNNVFRNSSLYHFTYEQAVNFTGCGLHISHNEFSNMPSSALWISGNDAIVENNLFENLATVCDDQGGFDTYKDPSYRGLVFRHNYWKNIGGRNRENVAAIRLDDLISGVLIEDNFFEQCGSKQYGAIEVHAGKDNIIRNNTIFNCTLAISFHNYENYWQNSIKSKDIQKKIYDDVNINSNVYKNKYPELKRNILRGADRNIINGNLIVNCDKVFSYRLNTNTFTQNKIINTTTKLQPNFPYGTTKNPYKQ